MLKDVSYFLTMRRAKSVSRRVFRIIRVLIKTIEENFRLANLGLKPAQLHVCHPNTASRIRSRAVLGAIPEPAGYASEECPRKDHSAL